MSLVDEIRARRGDPDDPTDQNAARREYSSSRRRQQGEDRANVNAGYRAGHEDAKKRAEGHENAKKRAEAKRRPASKKPAGRRRATRSLRAGVRQVRQPVAQHVTSGVRTLVLTLSVVALYLVLTAEEDTHAFSGALGGLSKALRWLSDPTASIPFGN